MIMITRTCVNNEYLQRCVDIIFYIFRKLKVVANKSILCICKNPFLLVTFYYVPETIKENHIKRDNDGWWRWHDTLQVWQVNGVQRVWQFFYSIVHSIQIIFPSVIIPTLGVLISKYLVE